MARVKICGINSPDALAAAADADWVGFNFYPSSPRAVTPSQAAGLSGGPRRVGLFVEPCDEEIAVALEATRLDILQIYADPHRAAQIRRKFDRPVWRAIGVASAADLPAPGEAVDGYVIEAKAPNGAALPGGNAVSFDWSLLKGWPAPLPWLLAGGLDPDNVRAAIAGADASAVDVSSGVERQRGRKDPALIRRFIAAARED